MARPKTSTLTERESQIMEILWRDGPSTSEQVREALDGKPHDSSVRTMLRVLTEKRLVKVDAKQRPAVYRASSQRETEQKKAVSNLINKMFAGSAESLVVRLIDDDQLTLEQLDELKQTLAKSKRKKGRKK